MGKCEIHCHWAHFLPTCLFLSMCKTLTTVVSIQLIFLPSVEVIVITLLGIFYEYRSLWEGNYRNCFLWRLHSQQEREDPLSMPKLFHVKTKKQAFPGQLQQLLNRLVSLSPLTFSLWRRWHSWGLSTCCLFCLERASLVYLRGFFLWDLQVFSQMLPFWWADLPLLLTCFSLWPWCLSPSKPI